MTDYINENDLVYRITKDDIQKETNLRIGRDLKEEEFRIVKKMVDYGISINLDLIYNIIFTEEIKK